MVLFFCIIFASCKSNDPADYRDAYAGTYAGNVTWTSNSIPYTFSEPDIIVGKSTSSNNEMTIYALFTNGILDSNGNILSAPGIPEQVTITVANDGSFTGAFTSIIAGASIKTTVDGNFLKGALKYEFSSAYWANTFTVDATKIN